MSDDDRTEPAEQSAAPPGAGDDRVASDPPPSDDARAPEDADDKRADEEAGDEADQKRVVGDARPEPPYQASYVFLVVVSFVTLALDLGTKAWAKATLEDSKSLSPKRVEVIADHLSMVFARNKGGAWGLLQDESEAVRRPFFLLISAAAVVFIVSLYRKLAPGQTALKWGLPLVLGGALGNLIDRVRYGYVIDFIDYRADWVRFFHSIVVGERASDHWPTFNVADIAICVGVGLMAVDMFTSRKKPPSEAPARAGVDAS